MSISSDTPGKPEKMGQGVMPGIVDEAEGDVVDPQDEHEVFRRGDGAVDFRTVGWPMASVIFLKRELLRELRVQSHHLTYIPVMFATGVLSIPTAMYSLGKNNLLSVDCCRPY